MGSYQLKANRIKGFWNLQFLISRNEVHFFRFGKRVMNMLSGPVDILTEKVVSFLGKWSCSLIPLEPGRYLILYMSIFYFLEKSNSCSNNLEIAPASYMTLHSHFIVL